MLLEAGAGVPAGYPDSVYEAKGARIAASRAEVFAEAQVVLQVRGYGANREAGAGDLELLREGQILAALLDPLGAAAAVEELARKGV